MNSRPPSDTPPPPAPTPREELEARLTALALGEAAEFDAATLRARLAADPELAALYRRIEAATLVFKNAFDDEHTAAALPPLAGIPAHLSPERAARITALFAEESAAPATPKVVELPSPQKPARSPWVIFSKRVNPFFAVAAVLLLVCVLTSLLIPTIGGVSLGMSKTVLNRAKQSNATPTEQYAANTPAPVSSAAEPMVTAAPMATPEPLVARSNENVDLTQPVTPVLPKVLSASELANSVDQQFAQTQAPESAAMNGLSLDNFQAAQNSIAPAQAAGAPIAAAQSINPTGQNWNSNYTFRGTDSLNMNGGALELDGASSTSNSHQFALQNSADAPLPTLLDSGVDLQLSGVPPPPPPPPPPSAIISRPASAPSGAGAGGGGFGVPAGAGGAAPGASVPQGTRGTRGSIGAGAAGGTGGGRRGGAAGGGGAATRSGTRTIVAPSDSVVLGVNANVTNQPVMNETGNTLVGGANVALTNGTGVLTVNLGTVSRQPGGVIINAGPPPPGSTFPISQTIVGSGELMASTGWGQSFGGSATGVDGAALAVAGGSGTLDTSARPANSLLPGQGQGNWASNDAAAASAWLASVPDNGAVAFDDGSGLTKIGTGTFTLTGNNSFNGSTNISSGTLQLGSANAFGSGIMKEGNLTLQSGGLNLNDGRLNFGSADSLDAKKNTNSALMPNDVLSLSSSAEGSLTGNVWTSQPIGRDGTNSLGNGQLAIIGRNLDNTSGSALTLSSLNNYTGNTTITGGTLVLGNNQQQQIAQLNYTNTSGTLSFGNETNVTLGGLSGNNAVALSVGSNQAPANYSGVISGAGSLTKTGAGTLTLDETRNTYGSSTPITGGNINNSNSDGTMDQSGLKWDVLTSYYSQATNAANGNTNTYTGDTSVQGGLINFSPAPNIDLSGSGLHWAAGSSSDNPTNMPVIGRLFPETATGNDTFDTLDTNSNNVTLANALSGTGGITKLGNGTLGLGGIVINSGSNASTFSGNVSGNSNLIVANNLAGGAINQILNINSTLRLGGGSTLTSTSDNITVANQTLTLGGNYSGNGTLNLNAIPSR
ncbi:MAG TPA: autotransporter-associated beta strand repeat-containing protein, partial [Opitutales bacterium]|nr:autotransporter-associated beta strand repeat-containing protein [Opitutales bacterium]